MGWGRDHWVKGRGTWSLNVYDTVREDKSQVRGIDL